MISLVRLKSGNVKAGCEFRLIETLPFGSTESTRDKGEDMSTPVKKVSSRQGKVYA